MTAYITIHDTGDVIELVDATIADADDAVASWMRDGIINSTGVASEADPTRPIYSWIINWKAVRSVRVTGTHPHADDPDKAQLGIRGVLDQRAGQWVLTMLLAEGWPSAYQ
ncbi:MAG: hypothetical protein JWN95_1339 [Frankiales bacterium]|nr:hypothetical protein [Frankiales bacterium]